MAVYYIGSYDIIDADEFQKYPPLVLALLPKYGGEVLASDTDAFVVEGCSRTMNAIIRFPSQRSRARLVSRPGVSRGQAHPPRLHAQHLHGAGQRVQPAPELRSRPSQVLRDRSGRRSCRTCEPGRHCRPHNRRFALERSQSGALQASRSVLACLRSAAVLGVDAYPVSVEVDVQFGLPGFAMVGLPDATVRESRDRVRSAIKNSGFAFPEHRITVNLAPADIRKAGSSVRARNRVGPAVPRTGAEAGHDHGHRRVGRAVARRQHQRNPRRPGDRRGCPPVRHQATAAAPTERSGGLRRRRAGGMHRSNAG